MSEERPPAADSSAPDPVQATDSSAPDPVQAAPFESPPVNADPRLESRIELGDPSVPTVRLTEVPDGDDS